MMFLLFLLILLDGATTVLKESPQYVTTAPSTFTIGNIKNMKPAKFINNLKSQKHGSTCRHFWLSSQAC